MSGNWPNITLHGFGIMSIKPRVQVGIKMNQVEDQQPETPAVPVQEPAPEPKRQVEHGGPKGPEPTRYGDWERNGRCIDF
jgi:hypothetical protein